MTHAAGVAPTTEFNLLCAFEVPSSKPFETSSMTGSTYTLGSKANRFDTAFASLISEINYRPLESDRYAEAGRLLVGTYPYRAWLTET